MDKQYNRVDNLDELIRSVKLPYLAWKVLFMVNKNTRIEEVGKVLEADDDAVNAAVSKLVEKGLILPADEEDKEEAETAPAEDEGETIAEEPQEEAVEEEAEEAAESEEEPEVVEEEEATETAAAEVEEESAEDEGEEALDELIAEAEEEGLGEEEPAEEEPQEEAVETAEEEPVEEEVAGEDEEKIEINIPEDDAQDDISQEMEFNFNLGDEEEADAGEAEVAEEEPPAEEEPEIDTSDYKKILVIDDSLVIRKMVEIALEEEELKIETAVSGKEGLDIIDRLNPDLVILDMMLPDINGIEILKTIKASKGIPVIMLSGKDSPQMIENAKAEGAEEFLPKPFKDDDLVDKVKKLIS